MTVVAAEEGFDYAFVDGLPALPAGAAQLRIGLQSSVAAHGPPLLFIPGAYHGAWCYAGWLKTCRAAGIPCAALDYRGHGSLAGRGLAPDTGVEAYADDVVAALSGQHTLGAGHGRLGRQLRQAHAGHACRTGLEALSAGFGPVAD